MRPNYFALCAASLLLASVTHCALAQDGAGSAPLISSGNPSNASPGSASSARRMLSDSEPALSDQSWTSTRTQPVNSATQSSRSVKHLSDGGSTGSNAAAQQRTNPTPAPLQAAPQHAESLRPVPSQSSSSPDSSWQSAASQARTAAGQVQTAGGAQPSTGASHLRSHVAQAQFTSTSTSNSTASPESGHVGSSMQAVSDEHRPLKPPTASDPAADQKRSTGTVQMFVSVISSLLIVVGLLLGAAWCYRKATPNLAGSLPKQALQVLGRTPLAPRQQLILVRFGPKLVLMSNLQGEVRTISEIVDPLEVDRICGMCESSQAGSISDSFRTVLHNIGRTG